MDPHANDREGRTCCGPPAHFPAPAPAYLSISSALSCHQVHHEFDSLDSRISATRKAARK
jgi:hypothetical protein